MIQTDCGISDWQRRPNLSGQSPGSLPFSVGSSFSIVRLQRVLLRIWLSPRHEDSNRTSSGRTSQNVPSAPGTKAGSTRPINICRRAIPSRPNRFRHTAMRRHCTNGITAFVLKSAVIALNSFCSEANKNDPGQARSRKGR
jgi:hypothetical protein